MYRVVKRTAQTTVRKNDYRYERVYTSGDTLSRENKQWPTQGTQQ